MNNPQCHRPDYLRLDQSTVFLSLHLLFFYSSFRHNPFCCFIISFSRCLSFAGSCLKSSFYTVLSFKKNLFSALPTNPFSLPYNTPLVTFSFISSSLSPLTSSMLYLLSAHSFPPFQSFALSPSIQVMVRRYNPFPFHLHIYFHSLIAETNPLCTNPI